VTHTPAKPQIEWLRDADHAVHREVHSVISAVVGQQGAVGWLHVPDAEETAVWLDRELRVVREGVAHFAVARVDGIVSGIGILSVFRPPVLAHNGEVRKLMTHPGARGRGVAKAVLLALESKARQLGLENLVLDVRGNNHGAMAVYESLGWLRCGVVPDFIATGDERFDQVNYVRALDRPAGLVLHGQRIEGPGASERRP
jgi:ribosomal protein S18 acetylase RimI-like enzyme